MGNPINIRIRKKLKFISIFLAPKVRRILYGPKALGFPIGPADAGPHF